MGGIKFFVTVVINAKSRKRISPLFPLTNKKPAEAGL
jgi:hypothetical protein